MDPDINQPVTPDDNSHNAKKKTLLTLGVIVLVIFSFLAGASSADRISLERLGINVLNQKPPENVTTVDYGLLWKALEVVSSQYVDKPVDQKKLMYGAVDGLLRALGDPHSTFLDPEEYKKFLDDLQGDFEGIGAEISVEDESLVVVAPLANSPAEKAGLLPEDTILKIDGEDTFGLDLEEAVGKIRGAKGTTVVLTVLHKGGDKTEDISIVRDAIHVESVTSETKVVAGRKIGVIKLSRFGPDTVAAFAQAIDGFEGQSLQGLVLDMRSNPGGLLDAAIDIASFWLPENKVVLKELNADKQESLYYAKDFSNRLAGIKTIILINKGSASASEIVTGALQDYKLATVVGDKSFGKGSVQDLVDIGNGASVKITIAKWLTPNGRSIDKQGLEPDVKVERTLDDYKNKRDPQMDRALEIISSN